MRVDTNDLIATEQIAERLGVRSTAVTNWKIRHPRFPRPIFECGRTRVYLWSEVSDWYDRYKGKVA